MHRSESTFAINNLEEIDDEVFNKSAFDDNFLVETIRNQTVLQKVDPKTVQKSFNFKDGLNKKPIIIEKLNHMRNLQFEFTKKVKQQKDYLNFSISSQIDYRDEVNKTAIITRRVNVKTYERTCDSSDEILAQCYMEILDYTKCLVVYSNKNEEDDLKIFVVERNEKSMNLIIEKLNKITSYIRNLTKEDFETIYNRFNSINLTESLQNTVL